MSRIAVISDRGLDATNVLEAVARSGHTTVAPAEAEVVVLVLGATPADRPVGLAPETRIVAVIDHAATDGGFPEMSRASIETDADAFTRARHAGAAIDWVMMEDHTRRAQGQPRLTVIGSGHGDDFGMARSLAADPMIIGRASRFRTENPQRPDRMPTPTNTIAPHHARARCVDGVIAVADLRSTNGTLVIRRGEPARLLVPQQAHSGREFGPPTTAWLVRDPTPDWVELRIGDQLQLPGGWRFRVDGDPAWRPD